MRIMDVEKKKKKKPDSQSVKCRIKRNLACAAALQLINDNRTEMNCLRACLGTFLFVKITHNLGLNFETIKLH